MKIKSILLALGAVVFTAGQAVHAEGHQVFYKYGISTLSHDRGGEIFTDTLANGGKRNDGTKGWNIGAGLDIPMLKDLGPGEVAGEIMAEYAHYSKKMVLQTAGHLAGAGTQQEVTVAGLNVTIAPKYRFTPFLDGKLRPWLIPIGLSFLVNSPPSNDTTYLDVGYHAGVGVEYAVLSALSLGLDYRRTFAAKEPKVDGSNSSIDFYAGINF